MCVRAHVCVCVCVCVCVFACLRLLSKYLSIFLLLNIWPFRLQTTINNNSYSCVCVCVCVCVYVRVCVRAKVRTCQRKHVNAFVSYQISLVVRSRIITHNFISPNYSPITSHSLLKTTNPPAPSTTFRLSAERRVTQLKKASRKDTWRRRLSLPRLFGEDQLFY